MYARTTNGRKDICRARFTLAKELSNAILNSVYRRRTQSLFYTAAADFVPRSRPRAFRKWATPTWNQWMAAGKAGATRAFPRKRASNNAISFANPWFTRTTLTFFRHTTANPVWGMWPLINMMARSHFETYLWLCQRRIAMV